MTEGGASAARVSKLERKLLRAVGRANKDFGLVEPGDRIMVAISGGKDSWTMLHLLRAYLKVVPFDFSIVAVNLDQAQPGFDASLLREHLESHGFDYKLIREDTYSVVKANVPAGKAYCSLCSRLRRGILYDTAVAMGCSKIALGHHRDDVVETAMLNLLYAGQLKAMPARLRSDDGRNVIVRPLVYCRETDIAEYAKLRAFPILPCDLCGSQDGLKRKRVKALLAELSREDERIPANVFAALGNVKPSHLYDPALPGGPVRPGGSRTEPGATDGAGPELIPLQALLRS